MRRSPQALCPSFGYFLDTPLSLPFGCVRPTSHLRMVDRQQEAWANARTSGRGVPVDCEARWRESLVDVGPPRGCVSQKSVRLASSNMDCVLLEQWCAWFRAQRTLTQKWGAATVVLDVVDFSRNEICDRGLSILVDLLLEQPPRVLRLFRDQISDATPIEKLLAKGSLHELHLSNNQISAASALRIAVSAATAVDKYGTHIYPISDVTLLWLRFENNFGSSNGFARELCQEMCKAKRPEAICFVDGKTSCNPKRCDCPGGPRAVHVLHVGSSIFNKRVHPASGEDQSRGSCTRHYTEWRTAAPKREKLPPSIAPWRRAAGPPSSPHAAHDLLDFPPLPGKIVEVPAVGDDRGDVCEEDGHGLPAGTPCYILLRGPCDGELSGMTLGVCTEEIVGARGVHV